MLFLLFAEFLARQSRRLRVNDHEIISMVILFLLLIQEGLLSVT